MYLGKHSQPPLKLDKQVRQASKCGEVCAHLNGRGTTACLPACLPVCRDVCVATPAGFRDPGRPPWEDRRQPLVPALASTGDPEGQPAEIPGGLAVWHTQLTAGRVPCHGKWAGMSVQHRLHAAWLLGGEISVVMGLGNTDNTSLWA